MSWLLSSPGSVLAMAICLRRDGYSLTTRKRAMSPSHSSSRFSAQGLAMPVSTRRGMPYRSCNVSAMVSGSNRPSGLSKTGLSSLPALST